MNAPFVRRSTVDSLMEFEAWLLMFTTTRKMLNGVLQKVPDSRINGQSYVAIRDHGTGLWVALTTPPVTLTQEIKDGVQSYHNLSVNLLVEAINADQEVRD